MSVVTLTLGGLTFQGFEVPDAIRLGGDQQLVVHDLPGGARVVDALGRVERDIGWSGRFRGTQAEQRAKQLDAMRQNAKPVMLTWSGYRFKVIVRSVEIEYLQKYEIPYAVSCVVLPPDPPKPKGPFNLTSALGPDLTNIVTLGGRIDVATINAALTNVQSAVSTAQSVYATASSAVSTAQSAIGAFNTLKGSFKGGIGGIADAIEQAQGATQGVIAQAEGTLQTAGLFTPGSSPSVLAGSLASAADGFGKLDDLYQMSNTLGRMARNAIP